MTVFGWQYQDGTRADGSKVRSMKHSGATVWELSLVSFPSLFL